MVYNRTRADNIFVSHRHTSRSWKIIIITLIIILAICSMVHIHHTHEQEAASHAAEARVVQGYKPSDAQKNLNAAIKQYETGKLATANLRKAHYKAVRISDPKARAHMVIKTNNLTHYMRSDG